MDCFLSDDSAKEQREDLDHFLAVLHFKDNSEKEEGGGSMTIMLLDQRVLS